MLSNRFLETLDDADRDGLMSLANRLTIAAGQDLYLPGDTVDWVYFPICGLVSLISVMINGDQAESAVIGREGAVGLIEAAGSGTMLYRAVVQLELEAVRVSASDYLALLNGSRALRKAVATHQELTTAEARQLVACLSNHGAKPRLAWWLLECQDRTGLTTMPLTQEFLAAMLGVQRTTVNQVANALKADGLVTNRRGAITILDRPGLEGAACECYGTIASYRDQIEGSGRADGS